MNISYNVWRLAAAGAAVALLASCDCFFGVHGRVVECGTMAPVAGAIVDVRIDSGFGGRQEDFPNAYTTDAGGQFTVHVNDPCESWATLTFRKDGFTPLLVQYEGAPAGAVAPCMTRAPAL
jgi:hypothetical protein